MTAYRSVIAGTAILALVSVLLFAALSDSGVTVVAAYELIALIIADVFATIYIAWLAYRDRRRPRSWLLLFMVTAKLQITSGLWLIAFPITRRLFDLPPLDPGLGLRMIAIGLIDIAFVPLMAAALFFLVQRDPSARRARDRIEDVGA